MTDYRVVLIGNYLPDRQQSMLRFADSLRRDLEGAGVRTSLWRPPALLGRGGPTSHRGLGKWLGYLDKYVLAIPMLVLARARAAVQGGPVVFHICDHSNAPYLRWLPGNRTLITCHDVIAIRGARGRGSSHTPASDPGRVLQRWILGSLLRGARIVAVSEETLSQLTEVAVETGRHADEVNGTVVPNALNAEFTPMESAKAAAVLDSLGVSKPYLMHLGSALPRKNRSMMLRLAADSTHRWPGALCFVGEALDTELTELAKVLGVAEQVVSVTNPSHYELVALYSSCSVFVFPSYAEGFGWPVVEAQACGAPVVASRCAPMPEVGGLGPVYADPTRSDLFAAAVASLEVPEVRSEAIRLGYKNLSRYRRDVLLARYLEEYRGLC